MANIEVNDNGSKIELTINDQALIRRYEKACGCDAKKITDRIEEFLSR